MTKFLFSVDVEDPYGGAPDGRDAPARVPQLVGRYLDFLRGHRAKATFFVVGEVARRHPELVRALADEGHEIGCHSDQHVTLDRLDRAGFREDAIRNLEALREAGAGRVTGYRAPCFSLTARTRWAHGVLADLGFLYSSSVLPAPSPLYGWGGFGRGPRAVEGGLWEIPVTILSFPMPPVPFAGGVYFRALPRWLVRVGLRAASRDGRPVVGYFHPHDIDTAQPRPAFAGFSRGALFDRLMHSNRDQVLDRLDMATRAGFEFAPFGPYAEALRAGIAHG